MAVRRVILVVDRSFGPHIAELPADAALWIIESADNRPFIVSLKKRFTPAVTGDLTWFTDDANLAPAEIAASKIDTIEDHHGEYSQRPAFSELIVIGAAPSPSLLSSVQEIGFRLRSTKDGVIAFERDSGPTSQSSQRAT